MRWIATATGDMTLSVVGDNGLQILKVDMLSAGTLKAGTEGDILVRTLNDLHVIANFSIADYDIRDDNLKYPGGGLSPLPWNVEYEYLKRKLVVRSGKRKIASRIFPVNVPEKYILEIVKCIEEGISIINSKKEE